MAIILAIESSCDDTSAAILKNSSILSNVIAGQKIHEEYGGVVPELASRAHQKNLVPVVEAAIKRAGISLDEVDGIAFTRGPGLMGSLVVGTSFAKALALAKNIPMMDVNHMQGHVLAHFIEDKSPQLPFLCLLVSGGHTQIVVVKEDYVIDVLGKTIDDAAGEAFDKAGKMLNLGYPAGPIIDKLATQGDATKFTFNTPKVEGLNFSFSGLKTSILYFLQKQTRIDPEFVPQNINDLCASIQHTIVSYLLSQLEEAMKLTGITQIGIAGGVAANSELRFKLQALATNFNGEAFIPKFEYCTDNAAMIAFAGEIKLKQKKYGTLGDVCFVRK